VGVGVGAGAGAGVGVKYPALPLVHIWAETTVCAPMRFFFYTFLCCVSMLYSMLRVPMLRASMLYSMLCYVFLCSSCACVCVCVCNGRCSTLLLETRPMECVLAAERRQTERSKLGTHSHIYLPQVCMRWCCVLHVV
jgi:hypothetical protein